MNAHTDRLEKGLSRAGIAATRRVTADGSPRLDVSDDVGVEVMLDLLRLGGKPYVVFGPECASPHMETPEEVVTYLREEGLLR